MKKRVIERLKQKGFVDLWKRVKNQKVVMDWKKLGKYIKGEQVDDKLWINKSLRGLKDSFAALLRELIHAIGGE